VGFQGNISKQFLKIAKSGDVNGMSVERHSLALGKMV
jgi:hypothetical protein